MPKKQPKQEIGPEGQVPRSTSNALFEPGEEVK